MDAEEEKIPAQPGLEAIPTHDAPEAVAKTNRSSLYKPEVVEHYDAPEVVPETDRSSLHKPEATGHSEYYAPEVYDENSSTPLNVQRDDKELARREKDKPESLKQQKRICGLRRRWFWTILVLALVVILAAVLGGVLGTVLHGSSKSKKQGGGNNSPSTTGPTSNSSSGSPIAAYDRSALATVVDSDAAMVYLYYQGENGTILELMAPSSNWSDTSVSSKTAVVASGAIGKSPVAAVGYSVGGTAFRQVFYVNNDNEILTTNTTGDSWTEPYSIFDSTMRTVTGIHQIAACSGMETGAYNGLRVYYGSHKGYVQEIGMDFSWEVYTWTDSYLEAFTDSDPWSGVACIVSDTFNQTHVYMRNLTTGSVVEWEYSNGWKMGAEDTSINNTMLFSRIGAVADNAGREYIFSMNSNGTVLGTTYYPGTRVIPLGNVAITNNLIIRSSLSALYNGSTGPVLLGQDDSEDLTWVQLNNALSVQTFEDIQMSR